MFIDPSRDADTTAELSSSWARPGEENSVLTGIAPANGAPRSVRMSRSERCGSIPLITFLFRVSMLFGSTVRRSTLPLLTDCDRIEAFSDGYDVNVLTVYSPGSIGKFVQREVSLNAIHEPVALIRTILMFAETPSRD